jgi:hypothetical protein
MNLNNLKTTQKFLGLFRSFSLICPWCISSSHKIFQCKRNVITVEIVSCIDIKDCNISLDQSKRSNFEAKECLPAPRAPTYLNYFIAAYLLLT